MGRAFSLAYLEKGTQTYKPAWDYIFTTSPQMHHSAELLNARLTDCIPALQEFKKRNPDKLTDYDLQLNLYLDGDDTRLYAEAAEGLSNASNTFHSQRGTMYSVEKEVHDSIWMRENPSDAQFNQVKWQAPSIHIEYEKSSQNPVILQKVNRHDLFNIIKDYNLYRSEIANLLCMFRAWELDEALSENPRPNAKDEIIIWKILCKKTRKPLRMGYFRGIDTFSSINKSYNHDDFDIDRASNYHIWLEDEVKNNKTRIFTPPFEKPVCSEKYSVTDEDEDVIINAQYTPEIRQETIADLEMAYSVLAYASTPYINPVPVAKNSKAKRQMRNNGVRVPSKGSIFRIGQLPLEIRVQEKSEVLGRGKSSSHPNGRIGYDRFLKHEKYKKSGLQYTWIPVKPILNKEGRIPILIGHKVTKRTKGTISVEEYYKVNK